MNDEIDDLFDDSFDRDVVSLAGRPTIEFTDLHWSVVNRACMMQNTGEEIAKLLGISYDTLSRRINEKYAIGFAEYYAQRVTAGTMSLRRWQWRTAKLGNPTMQIWLGKQHLGQKETVELQGGMNLKLSYNLDEIDDSDTTANKLDANTNGV